MFHFSQTPGLATCSYRLLLAIVRLDVELTLVPPRA